MNQKAIIVLLEAARDADCELCGGTGTTRQHFRVITEHRDVLSGVACYGCLVKMQRMYATFDYVRGDMPSLDRFFTKPIEAKR